MKTATPYHRSVNYYETDKMAIVHHSNYIRYFEEARLHWMHEVGLEYSAVEQMGLMIPVMFAECKYLVPLQFGQEVEIQVRLDRFDGIKMEFSYEIRNCADGKLCTTGRTGHCFLDDQMRPVRMKKNYPDLYRTMQEALVRDGGTGKVK